MQLGARALALCADRPWAPFPPLAGWNNASCSAGLRRKAARRRRRRRRRPSELRQARAPSCMPPPPLALLSFTAMRHFALCPPPCAARGRPPQLAAETCSARKGSAGLLQFAPDAAPAPWGGGVAVQNPCKTRTVF